jgi:hypothetical protein
MRPYLAIIKDSFREALASRVLWVMTGLIVLLLALLAPLGYSEKLTGEFAWGDIADAPQLVQRLKSDYAADKPSPGRRIWSLFDEATRGKLEKFAERDDRGEHDGGDYMAGLTTLRKSLNKLLARRDFYRAEDWQVASLSQEARELLARKPAQLSTAELTRLNRLLIESPLQAHFAWRSPQSLAIGYFGLESDPLPFGKAQVEMFIKQWVLTSVMSWIVGVFGMIAAILVTSTVIPQMFEPGSITLLLSKPISRSLLFTAKYIGACAFVLLNVSLHIIGLWLIVGWRFAIWNQGMLWCIPVFLFMFLIYYAVSALSGLVWKSAVISVVLTVLFWLICFIVDLTHAGLDGAVLERQRISRVVWADGALLSVAEGNRVQLWDKDSRAWQRVSNLGGGGIPTVEGPYWHEPSRQLVVGQGFRHPFGGRTQRISLKLASSGDGWKLRDGPKLPGGTSSLAVMKDGTLLAIAPDNIYRFTGDLASKEEPLTIFGLKVPMLGGGGKFRPCLPAGRTSFTEPIAVAADANEPRLVLSAGNDVYVFELEADGGLNEAVHRSLTGNAFEGSAVAIAGKSVLVAREEGKVLLLSADDLKTQRELVLESESQPRFVAASPDGTRFAVQFQNRYLWLVEAATGASRRAPLPAQGQISGLHWTADELLIADYANRVVAYDPKTLTRREVYQPELSRAEFAYYYIFDPLYTIFPKPRMLNKTVQYLMTGERTTDMGFFQGDLSQQREDLHPWQPVRSGLVFIGVMLLAACVYLERHEF